MSDEPTVVAAPAAAPASQSISPVNADGSFTENWRESIDEDIRGEKVFDRAQNFNGAMRSLFEANRMVGADKMVRPNESSGDDAWNDFYDAGGRPATAAEYGFQRPEALAEENYSEERATAAAEFMHNAGLSTKQAQALFAMHNDGVIKKLADQATNIGLAAEELNNGLVNDWGNAYEAKKHLGNAAISKGLEKSQSKDPEFKDRVLEKINKDPDLLRFMGDLGGFLQESNGIEIPITTGDTPETLDTELHELMTSDAFNNRTHPQHKAAMAKQDRLMEKGARTRR